MANTTVPGGAYQLPDGSWINANGRPIAAPKGNVYEPRGEDLALELKQVTGSGDEFEKPENEVKESEPSKARKVTKKSE